jgi:hypothetical protein
MVRGTSLKQLNAENIIAPPMTLIHPLRNFQIISIYSVHIINNESCPYIPQCSTDFILFPPHCVPAFVTYVYTSKHHFALESDLLLQAHAITT